MAYANCWCRRCDKNFIYVLPRGSGKVFEFLLCLQCKNSLSKVIFEEIKNDEYIRILTKNAICKKNVKKKSYK